MVVFTALRQFSRFGGDSPSDFGQLFPAREFVRDDGEQLGEFRRELDLRRENDPDTAVLPPGDDPPLQALDDLGRSEKAVKVEQQNHAGCFPGVDDLGQGSQGIPLPQGFGVAGGWLEALFDVPDLAVPVLGLAELLDFLDRFILFAGLDPKTGETGADIIGELVAKGHFRFLVDKLRGKTKTARFPWGKARRDEKGDEVTRAVVVAPAVGKLEKTRG